ncbi:MAG: type II secretion system F family protein [Candidatus Omnitrophica bacterium]|nr:type II secretion system F family protein [Candidatus Omnitrophota bacterium]
MAITLFLVFCTAALIGYSVVPTVYNKTVGLSQKRAQKLSNKLDRIIPRQQIQKISQVYLLAPLVGGAIGYAIAPAQVRVFSIVIGIAFGVLFPGLYTKALLQGNRRKFNNQLIDALMIMSSSFRGGLSLIQAMEAVVEEMPDPINQEFGTVLGENKMGVSLEEAFNHLYNRMPSSALQQMTTAILLARETGGNLPAIFSRIVGVIREQKRVQGQIDTLTIQGKIQGVVMSLLPVAFFFIVYGANPTFFNHMIQSQNGRALLIYAAFSEIIGAAMIWKISTSKDY